MSDANGGHFRVVCNPASHVEVGSGERICQGIEARMLELRLPRSTSSFPSNFLRTQTRPAIEFVSGKEGLRPHLVRLHGRPEQCNGPWLLFVEQRGDVGTGLLSCSVPLVSQVLSFSLPCVLPFAQKVLHAVLFVLSNSLAITVTGLGGRRGIIFPITITVTGGVAARNYFPIPVTAAVAVRGKTVGNENIRLSL